MPLSIVSAMKAITALRQGAEAVGHIGAPSSPRQGAKVFHLSPSGAEVAHGDADANVQPTAAGVAPVPVATLYSHPLLKDWLGRDYRQAGYDAGRASPNHEALSHDLNALSTSFEILCLKLDADLRARIALAEQRALDTGPTSPLTAASLTQTMTRLRADIEEVAKQRQAGRNGDPGWCAEAKANFVAGFHRAMQESAIVGYYLRY